MIRHNEHRARDLHYGCYYISLRTEPLTFCSDSIWFWIRLSPCSIPAAVLIRGCYGHCALSVQRWRQHSCAAGEVNSDLLLSALTVNCGCRDEWVSQRRALRSTRHRAKASFVDQWGLSFMCSYRWMLSVPRLSDSLGRVKRRQRLGEVEVVGVRITPSSPDDFSLVSFDVD